MKLIILQVVFMNFKKNGHFIVYFARAFVKRDKLSGYCLFSYTFLFL